MRAEAIGRDESPAELIAGYTPKQREAYLRGLRILAKINRHPGTAGKRLAHARRLGVAPGPAAPMNEEKRRELEHLRRSCFY